MLRAVVKNKGRHLVETSVVEGKYDGNEDLLTAAVFSRLSYLDDDTLHAVLARLLRSAWWTNAGSLRRVEFWPRYQVEDRTVEPDVVFEFEFVSLWVEAKRWDGVRMQSPEQLRTQYRASQRVVGPDRKVIQLAIGGGGKSEPLDLASEPGQVVQLASWEQLAYAVQGVSSATSGQQRILDDIAVALRLHQVFPEAIVEMQSFLPVEVGRCTFPEWPAQESWSGLVAAGLVHQSMRTLN